MFFLAYFFFYTRAFVKERCGINGRNLADICAYSEIYFDRPLGKLGEVAAVCVQRCGRDTRFFAFYLLIRTRYCRVFILRKSVF